MRYARCRERKSGVFLALSWYVCKIVMSLVMMVSMSALIGVCVAIVGGVVLDLSGGRPAPYVNLYPDGVLVEALKGSEFDGTVRESTFEGRSVASGNSEKRSPHMAFASIPTAWAAC
jgi:hypothetical protein